MRSTRPSSHGRRIIRIVVLTVVVAMVSLVSTGSASAEQLALQPLPGVGEFGSWVASLVARTPVFTNLPVQASGSAAGRGHDASTAETTAGGGSGRPPGKAGSELPADDIRARTIAAGASGKAVTGFDEKTSRRDPKQSSETVTAFVNTDGSVTREYAQTPVNYRYAAGAWQPIDVRVASAADGRLHEVANSRKVDFAPTAADPALASFAVDAAHGVSYGLTGALPVAPKAAGSTVTYAGALPNTDVVLAPTPTGLKESLVLASAAAPSSWSFPLKLTGLTPVLAKDGSVELRDGAGAVRERIPPGYAHDAKIDPASGEPATTYSVRYALTTVGGVSTLQVTLDPRWLADPARVFPVTVDPTFNDRPNSTYAESDLAAGDHSMESTVKIGSFNSGPASAATFLQFPKDVDGSNVTVNSATLKLYNVFASSCSAQRLDVALVTQAWTPSTVTSYPGPTKGASVGNATPSVPHACLNTSGSRTGGDWVNVSVSSSAIQGWANGSTTDYGLAVYAATTDSVHWKTFASANQIDYNPVLVLTTSGNVAPQVDTTFPANAGVTTSLTPTLIATGHDIDANPNASVQFDFQVFDGAGTKLADSGLIASGNYTVPANKLKYGQTYYWTVQTYDGSSYSPPQPSAALSVQVPQPPITSSLSQNSELHGTDPSIGNYTTSETDADVATAGPSLALTRDYNSRDPRTAGGFGAGWSSLVDARAVERYDGAGAVNSVVVTYPAGTEVGYGKNADGTFSPPSGRFATLKAVTGGYTLTDKNDTLYTFTQTLGGGVFGATAVADANGRAENLTWVSGQVTTITAAVSGRKLALTWTTPSGATSPHVASVVTDPVTAGQPSTALTWTYSYTGDQLTSVCPPGTTTACTRYQYTSGSQYRTLSLDQGPRSFWGLDEASGSAATSAVLANGGSDVATYANVTLGQPGPLTGSTATAAGFNGTSSQVVLPRSLMAGMSTQSLSLWFKTTTANGVLFSYSALPLGSDTSTTAFYTPALYVGSDGKLQGEFWMGSVSPMTSPAAVTDGNWHHVVLAASGSSQKMFLDGAQVATLAGTVAPIGPQNNYYLGAGWLGGDWPNEPNPDPTTNVGKPSYFTGSIADVGFYTNPLALTDVTALYTARSRAASLLSTVTRPSGNTHATVTYDPSSAAVTQLTDENGGVWKYAAPTASGSSQIYRASVLGSAPSGYFRLGDTAGAASAADEINAGTAAYSTVGLGGTGPFPDQPAASFNGTSSSVAPPDVDRPTGSGPNSVEMWFKTATANGPGGILYSTGTSTIDAASPSSTATPVLYVGSDGKLYAQFRTGSVAQIASTVKVNDAAWHHVVLAGNGTTQALFLDGTQAGTRTGATIASTDPLAFVGAGYFNSSGWSNKQTTGWNHFTGSIAEVAFYKSALTQADANAHFLAARNSQGLSPLTSVTITDPGNATLVDTYDPLHSARPVTLVNAVSKKTSYGYDTGGFLRTITDPNGNVVTTGHDVRGNPVSRTTCQNLATNTCATEYRTHYPDNTSAQLTTADPRNDLTLTQRDARSSGPTDNTFLTTYTYDTAGNRTGVTAPPVPGFPNGRTTTTTFSDGTATYLATDSGNVPKGLPVKITSPGNAITTLTYLHTGDVASMTNADGLLVRFTYDGVGRMATKTEVSDTFPTGLTTSFTYNGLNNLLGQIAPPVVDRVTGATHTATIAKIYDADGRLTNMTVSDPTGGDSSRTATTSYNTSGQATSLTDAAGNVLQRTYDPYGNIATETDPNGTTTTFAYDPVGRLLTRTIPYTGSPVAPQSAAPLVLESRAYDPAGRLAAATDSMGNVDKYTYFGDGSTATITRTDPGGSSSFVQQSTIYDGAGNVTSKVTNNGATTAQYTIDGAGRTAKTVWDPAGLARSTSVSFTPDDKPSSTVESDRTGTSRTTTATYDPMGNQTSQTVAGLAGGGPVAWFPLDQTSGTAVADSSGSGNNATATGVTWTSSAAKFAGSSAQGIATPGPVINTASTFSVSAWANLSNKNDYAAVASQDAVQTSGFFLQYDPGFDRWSFERNTSDVANPAAVRVTGASAPSTGTWYHLVAVFESSTNTMSLYVNGALAGTVNDPTPIASNGPFVIGRSRYAASPTDFFPGSIDNVQAYPRALSASDVTSLYTAGRAGTLTAPPTPVTTSQTLDRRGRPTSVTDPDGNVTSLAYDEVGHLAVTTEPTVAVESNGGVPVSTHPVTSTGYNTFGEATEAQDPNGNVTITAYDAAGRPVSQRDPTYTPPGSSTSISPLTVMTYDHNGWLTSESDPLNNTTSYLYDQLGHLVRATDPAGGKTVSAFDTNGDVLSVTDASNAQTQATYDFLGRRVTGSVLERYPSTVTATTSYSYAASTANPGGAWLASTTSPTGVATRAGYDALGEAISTTDGAANVTTTGYDFLGRPVSTMVADGTSSVSTLDLLGNKTRQVDKDASGTALRQTSAMFDPASRMLTSTDARGTITTFTYDAGGALTQEVQPVATGSSITTAFAHDAAGNRTRYTDGRGNPRIFTFNSWNMPESLVEPAAGTYTSTADRTYTKVYDAAARLTSFMSPGGVSTSSTYDSRGNLTGRTGTGAEAATATRTFGYDAVNRMTTANTGAVGTAGSPGSVPATADTFTYNDRDELLTAAGSSGGSQFGYNPDGAVISRADAAGTSAYTYDTTGRPTTATDAATGTASTYTYNNLNQVAQISYGTGGSVRAYGYDGLHRLTGDSLKTSGGAAVASIGYAYDPNSNITTKTTTGFAGAAANTYTYDLANRLSSWNNGTATTNYGYDAAGNRTTAGSTTYTYDARNQLTSDGANAYSYSARGTMTLAAGVTSTSDAFGQTITRGGRGHSYDALSRVLTDTTAGATAGVPTFAFSGTGNLVASDGANTYAYGAADELIGIGNAAAGGTTTTAGSGTFAFVDRHTDLVGRFTATGTALAGSTTYDPWGKPITTASPQGKLGFQSGWTDPAGSVDMAARWYNPALGQFNDRDTFLDDPVPNSGAANPFAYIADNPQGGVDTTGHCPWCIAIIVGAILGTISAVVHPRASAPPQTYRIYHPVYSTPLNNNPVRRSAPAPRRAAPAPARRAPAPAPSHTTRTTSNHVQNNYYGDRSANRTTSHPQQRPTVKHPATEADDNDDDQFEPKPDPAGFYRAASFQAPTDNVGQGSASGRNSSERASGSGISWDAVLDGVALGVSLALRVIGGPGLESIAHHPAAAAGLVLGIGLIVVSGAGEVGGGVLTLSVAGAEIGIPLVAVSTAGIAAGWTLAGTSAAIIASDAEGSTGNTASSGEMAPESPSIKKNNYRGRYNAEQYRQGKDKLPDDWDAHHAIPQKYDTNPEFRDFDFDAPSNIRGLPGSRMGSRGANVHQDITNQWKYFDDLHPNASRAQIEDFARQIDRGYGAYYW